ncbi:MAG: septum formation protein Maf [Betaproteobacteria bacterium]|nr:septum formation protein Maf [Betaproteobacteria bacterium]
MPATATTGSPELILASTSVYRRQLLERLHLRFRVCSPGTDESARAGETPAELARRLALAKADAVAAGEPAAVVIGSDQTATLDGRGVIGKPSTLERAREQLRAASGQLLTFHTALAVICQARQFARVEVVDTRVRFRALSDAAIDRYLALEPALDCAGSAKAEGLGIALMSSFESDDPTAIIGLPLIALNRMLREAGIDALAQPAS